MASIDELDRQIIHLLQEDGRASNALVARSAEESEGTVRQRHKRLFREGIIRIAVAPNLERAARLSHQGPSRDPS